MNALSTANSELGLLLQLTAVFFIDPRTGETGSSVSSLAGSPRTLEGVGRLRLHKGPAKAGC